MTAGERPAPMQQVERRTRPESPQDAAGAPQALHGFPRKVTPRAAVVGNPRDGEVAWPGLRWPGNEPAGGTPAPPTQTQGRVTPPSPAAPGSSCPGLGGGCGGTDILPGTPDWALSTHRTHVGGALPWGSLTTPSSSSEPPELTLGRPGPSQKKRAEARASRSLPMSEALRRHGVRVTLN